MKENSFSYRFNLLLKEKPMTQKEVARIVGVRQSTISGWKNGTVDAPNLETGKKVARLFDCAIEWLMFGVGAQKTEMSNRCVIPFGHYKYVAKQPWFVKDNPGEIGLVSADDRSYTSIRASTPSMEPLIKEGDLLLIDESQKDVSSPAIYAFFIEDRFYIANLGVSMSGKYIATTYTPRETITLEIMPTIIGRVIRRLESI